MRTAAVVALDVNADLCPRWLSAIANGHPTIANGCSTRAEHSGTSAPPPARRPPKPRQSAASSAPSTRDRLVHNQRDDQPGLLYLGAISSIACAIA